MHSIHDHLRREWVAFRRPGRLIALTAAALAVIAVGLLSASGTHSSCPDGPCPTDPAAADGSTVSDRFYFLHRDLGRNGSITVRMTSMTGTITYPPPDHDEIVSALVPWAKAGIIVKDGVQQGSAYAALMMTGSHGVRMQYDYRHDIAGSPGTAADVSATSPRWLRLTRSGDTITGYESTDGNRWSTVGTAKLEGLPETVRVGLFATSPGDLTLRPVALGGAIEESRFTQATGVFDNIRVNGPAGGPWRSAAVGEMNHTDWEKHHNASGVVETNGTIRISGTGDIGPVPTEGARTIENTIIGLIVALVVVIVVAARFGTAGYGRGQAVQPARRTLAARAIVVATAGFVTGLVAVGATIPAGIAILTSNGVPVQEISLLTGVRVVAGLAVVLALAAVLALALGALLRRGWLAVLVAVSGIALPYAITALPLLPDGVAQWLLRLTPAAGFAVQQTHVEYPQVVAHYAPSAGYFPLPGWAGLAVLCTYTTVVLYASLLRLPSSRERHSVDWR
ncbi:MAG: hypothetical protein ACRDP8_03555, partial [Actinopolymorphaceae bacterium]